MTKDRKKIGLRPYLSDKPPNIIEPSMTPTMNNESPVALSHALSQTKSHCKKKIYLPFVYWDSYTFRFFKSSFCLISTWISWKIYRKNAIKRLQFVKMTTKWLLFCTSEVVVLLYTLLLYTYSLHLLMPPPSVPLPIAFPMIVLFAKSIMSRLMHWDHPRSS